MLVYTPKGNIPVVGNYLHQCGLLLDHPTPPYEMRYLVSQNQHYYNPHNPPPGGHRANSRLYPQVNNGSRWSTPQVSGKSVEVQRSQVDELFKSLKSGDELAETEPSACHFQISLDSGAYFMNRSRRCDQVVPASKEGPHFLVGARTRETGNRRQILVLVAAAHQ